jgi:predicted transcriptional regulator of viral defense system/very-short-patch-repair endonuclease
MPSRPMTVRKDINLAIATLAARQHGVIALWQLTGLGLSARAARGRVASGRLFRLHRGVYAVGHPRVSPSGRALAAVLACGEGAVLSHRSAAQLWGMRRDRGLPEVTVPRTGARRRHGMRVHVSTTLTAGEVTVHDGIPVTTPARTLTDLADVVTDLADVVTASALEAALATAERLGLVDRRELAPAPGRRRVVRGSHRFTRSEFERRFLAAVRAWRLPVPETNQTVAGWEVDCVWRERRLVVELDHPYTHTDPRAFERDRLKDERLEDAGYVVRRVTEERFRRRPADVRAMLVRRLG